MGAGLLAGMAWSGAAGAQLPNPTEREAVRVHYTGHPGCPKLEVFLAELTRLAPQVQPAKPNELARTLDLVITLHGAQRSVGKVSMTLPDGNAVTAEATGPCAHVARVLARVAATTLNPDAGPRASDAAALPENPYWRMLGELTRPDPVGDNPYRQLLTTVADDGAQLVNPYHRWLACRRRGGCCRAPSSG